MNYNTLTTEEILQHAYMAENCYTHPLYVELRKRLETLADRKRSIVPSEYAGSISENETRELLDSVVLHKPNFDDIGSLCRIISTLVDYDIHNRLDLLKVLETAKAMLDFRAECASGIRSLVEYFDNNTPIEL